MWYITTCWLVICSTFQTIVQRLQQKADQVYEKEKLNRTSGEGIPPLHRQAHFPTGPRDFRRTLTTVSLRGLGELLEDKVRYRFFLKRIIESYSKSLSLNNFTPVFAWWWKSENLYYQTIGEMCVICHLNSVLFLKEYQTTSCGNQHHSWELDVSTGSDLKVFKTHGQLLHAIGPKVMKDLLHNLIIGTY